VERLYWFYIDDPNGVYLMKKDGVVTTGAASGATWPNVVDGWNWRSLLGNANTSSLSIMGIDSSGLDVVRPVPGALRWFWLTAENVNAAGVSVRGFTMPGGNNLNSDNFNPGAPLGDRGELILGAHQPELFFPVTLDGARSNIFLNFGFLDGLVGTARDDDGALEWFPG
jgi:hypothetical protein